MPNTTHAFTKRAACAEAPQTRRRLVGALSLIGLVGCGGSGSDGTTASTATTGTTDTSTTTSGSCAVIPSETAGPYPADGTNTNSGSVVDVISSSLVRQNITEGKTGLPLTLTLTLVDVNNGCTPIANAAIYIWHCDKDGEYSAYTTSANGSHFGETYLRGIQVTDSNGQVSFTTIYPGWYAGRVTHIHFEVYAQDNLSSTPAKTSQIAFPEDITSAVYALSNLYTKGQNTSVATNAADNVFSDGTTYQLASLSGDTTNGYVASLSVGIAA